MWNEECGIKLAVGAATATLEISVETLAALAHPTNAAGGNACHKGIVGDIAGDNGSGGYEGGTTYSVTTDNGAIGAKRRSLLNQGLGIDSMNGEMGTGRGDIGEHTRRTAEYIVLNLNALRHRHIVLYANAIAYAQLLPMLTF